MLSPRPRSERRWPGPEPTPDDGLNVFVGSDGSVSRYDPHAPNPLDALPPMDLAAEAGSRRDVRHASGDVVDQRTVESWIELNMVTGDAKALIRAALSGVRGVSTGALSLLGGPSRLGLPATVTVPGLLGSCTAGGCREFAPARKKPKQFSDVHASPGIILVAV